MASNQKGVQLMSDREDILEQVEETYMNGFADEVSGDVEAPTGHFYRVGQYIVVTNSQGFKTIYDHRCEEEAEVQFDTMNEEYCEWDDSE